MKYKKTTDNKNVDLYTSEDGKFRAEVYYKKLERERCGGYQIRIVGPVKRIPGPPLPGFIYIGGEETFEEATKVALAKLDDFVKENKECIQ